MAPRPHVKICGLTRIQDVELACRLGADAIGVIFAPSSRRVDPDRARLLAEAVPAGIRRVGVFGPDEAAGAAGIASACGLDTIQLHGAPDLARCAALRKRFRVVQALGVGHGDLAALEAQIAEVAPLVDAILLDTAIPGQLGGTGQTFDWRLLPGLASPVPVIVAGGLRPDNVASLIVQAAPWGIDVASGVEAAPGVKDAEKLRAFFGAIEQTIDTRANPRLNIS